MHNDLELMFRLPYAMPMLEGCPYLNQMRPTLRSVAHIVYRCCKDLQSGINLMISTLMIHVTSLKTLCLIMTLIPFLDHSNEDLSLSWHIDDAFD
jgi:hypothetical protein